MNNLRFCYLFCFQNYVLMTQLLVCFHKQWNWSFTWDQTTWVRLPLPSSIGTENHFWKFFVQAKSPFFCFKSVCDIRRLSKKKQNEKKGMLFWDLSKFETQEQNKNKIYLEVCFLKTQKKLKFSKLRYDYSNMADASHVSLNKLLPTNFWKIYRTNFDFFWNKYKIKK